MLFDDIERTNDDPPAKGESLYAFLNRAAGAYWESVRDLLSEWLSNYPEAERFVLSSRFRATDRRGFLGAFWELYLHELFRRLGFEITLHPRVSGTTRRPDFLLKHRATSTFVEAVTIYEAQGHPRGSHHGHDGTVDDHRAIRQRLGEKTRAYGRQLGAPYMIALISYRPTTDLDELLTGLFGAAQNHPEMIRAGIIQRSQFASMNGFWLTSSGSAYEDASAVLTTFELMPWSVARCQPWLITNPWASHPLEIELPFNRVVVETTTGNIEQVETGFEPARHFGLPGD